MTGRWGIAHWVALGTAVVLWAAAGVRADEAGAGSAEVAKIHTADCEPVEPGAFEWFLGLEAGTARRAWDADRNATDRGGRLHETSLLFALTRGIARDLDVGVAVAYDAAGDDATGESARGLGDLTVAPRWKFASVGVWGVALLPSLTLPTGTAGDDRHAGTTQGYSSGGLGAVAVAALRRASLNVDLGCDVPFGSDRGDARETWIADAALGWHVHPRVQAEVELNYATAVACGAPSSTCLACTAGLLFLTERLGRFQLGAQPPLWGRGVDRMMSVHLAWVY